LFATPTISVAEQRAARGRPVWLYRFDFQTPGYFGRLGAAHCLDLPFVFDNFDKWSLALLTDGVESPGRDGLCTAMHQAWISFIRTGDPNHAALPKWDRYAGENPATMRFDTVSASIDGPRTGAPNRV
jgi:para-nitrobenzyl esterase